MHVPKKIARTANTFSEVHFQGCSALVVFATGRIIWGLGGLGAGTVGGVDLGAGTVGGGS